MKKRVVSMMLVSALILGGACAPVTVWAEQLEPEREEVTEALDADDAEELDADELDADDAEELDADELDAAEVMDADKKDKEDREDKEDKEESSEEMEAARDAAEVSDDGDQVVITKADKPYLSLGADLTADQQHQVLELMGIQAADFDQYDVTYVNNTEEHAYLDAYVPKEKIGTKSLSSVFISLGKKGDGIKISTYNINYCTVGMYKNALSTAGITDANIIVAGPFPLSGTAALVGTFQAYEEMTGESLDDEVVDAAMNELVTTGELEQSIDADSSEVEAMIAELKGRMAKGEFQSREDIVDGIKEVAKEYGISLSEDEMNKLADLLNKLKDLDIDWDSLADTATKLVDELGSKFGDQLGDADAGGIGAAISAFFQKLIDAILSIFS